MNRPVWAIGLMTGTVLDGNIDIAAIKTDGRSIEAFGPWTLARYPDHVRDLIAGAVTAARDWNFEGAEPPVFAEAERALTQAQSVAVRDFIAANGFAPSDIRIVGFHGQTVLHRPPRRDESGPARSGATRQLGDGAAMAAALSIDVAWDFRSSDMAAGGHGAPLAPSYHMALLDQAGLSGDTAVLNLGGVANLSLRDGAQPHGFDTGPANAPCNDWIRQHLGSEMDRDGLIASRGRVDEDRLARLLDHPFFAAPYPKSLDRNSFTCAMADGLSLEDGAATLVAFSAAAVGRGLDRLPRRPTRLIVCGGGRRNPALMRELALRTGCTVQSAEEVGWRGDAVEAECFAFLAVRTLLKEPISFPTTTGVPAPQTGGRLSAGHHRLAAGSVAAQQN